MVARWDDAAVARQQLALYARFDVKPLPVEAGSKVGISLNVREGVVPVHGVRVKPENGTNGWYIWAGEYSSAADFYKPLHVEHLGDWSPLVLPFLSLPVGWRFLTDGPYVDVWFDPSEQK